ncbi:hypothetical protein MP638_002117 [Amoeboaphelidium occidentale]|nr:hypothetical protein MP638_002117 [Amoeboaphelidium occidentale]
MKIQLQFLFLALWLRYQQHFSYETTLCSYSELRRVLLLRI